MAGFLAAGGKCSLGRAGASGNRHGNTIVLGGQLIAVWLSAAHLFRRAHEDGQVADQVS